MPPVAAFFLLAIESVEGVRSVFRMSWIGLVFLPIKVSAAIWALPFWSWSLFIHWNQRGEVAFQIRHRSLRMCAEMPCRSP